MVGCLLLQLCILILFLFHRLFEFQIASRYGTFLYTHSVLDCIILAIKFYYLYIKKRHAKIMHLCILIGCACWKFYITSFIFLFGLPDLQAFFIILLFFMFIKRRTNFVIL